ncbi:biotin--[acetyl-CoA-carboxylase] ligase [Denitratisoma oestradiolicum]|uniref:biotin--[biotin carboxyl-carrier protein] ligase n=1 Tax=Denitratisoma oestradiolicum TaxID=311182 RepID=A0A6S6Y282_9PROT|nr:biotin--[acetyl-CoA-carboxylase] ligase [Denitratisoma oestradiolicum]TWO80659.1 biotin--[acetyl-CoA-carboxylase] ligase [Denitratisoma oestradiolicum]CAB1371063.1 putative biotin--acetyl-CoA-carboxylase ligase [Denitratisoma oestradiolicum]
MNMQTSFDIAAAAAALGTTACRYDIDAVAECDSSNSRLLERAAAGAPSGTVLVAERQTAGRGRRGRSWISAPADSLTFSLLWRFPHQSDAPAALSLAVGLALVRGLEALGARGIGLKWPNDLLIGDSKLAGILVELQAGELRSAVIGIGLNLRRPNGLSEDVAAAGLDQALAALPTREVVLAALLAALAQTLDAYGSSGFASLRNEWQARHAWQGLPVRVSGGEAAEGLCLGVGDDGALNLDTPQGLRRILAGDVSLRAVP